MRDLSLCLHPSIPYIDYRRFSRASKGYVVQQRAIVANGGGFPNHDPCSVVHEHAL